jgi:hypothetical protein
VFKNVDGILPHSCHCHSRIRHSKGLREIGHIGR